MELSPTYSESPPDGSVAAACCDFTTCCYSGLCAVLCFTGVAITFIFSSAPDQDAGLGVATPQTWLLGPVLILLSVLVAVKTLMHVRKQRLRLAGGRQRRRRRRRRPDSLDQAELESGLELSLPPRGHDLPPSYEEVMKLMQEERRGPPPPPPPPPPPLPPPAEVVQ
ncbi:trem-like transcript 1 protein [Amphibalanus amphitrite]|uniref:trem-like transcript 1 protein n=1 Tax=Amphibalanus amphitrite TaxID=1232801 RepID=UPI001C8FE7B6|nr:trem-like transcript 1 protein [Amphibalanus amphitrite]